MREIPLNRGAVALIDDEDYELVNQFKWSLQVKDRYAGRSYCREDGKRAIMRMHNFITGALCIDHKDRKGLNNQRCNLRSATQSLNMVNRLQTTSTPFGYRGVTKHRRRWVARICLNKIKTKVGSYYCIHEAARAYNTAAKELHGEFAILNEIQHGQ